LSRPVDHAEQRPVVASETRFVGRVWSIRTDTVQLDEFTEVVRDVLVHPGAVGVVALDDSDRMLLIRQYRHAAGSMLWEAPAGLLDVDGEPALACAKRELLEETGYLADTWHVLVDYWNSPGGSTEAFRCYLARDLRSAPGGRPEGAAEERDLPISWVPLADAVSSIHAGELGNPTTVIGALAADSARITGWRTLRPADASWPARPDRA
jgi:8-oxo-dGTP pyrophosphatase MutT (NUDIX family)